MYRKGKQDKDGSTLANSLVNTATLLRHVYFHAVVVKYPNNMSQVRDALLPFLHAPPPQG